MGTLADNVRTILSGIPENVDVVAVAKGHTAQEIREVVDAGIRLIGENYLQEARSVIPEIGSRVAWHFTGHVQKNKVKLIVPLFDLIQTLDSYELAAMVDEHAKRHGKVMPVLVEVNSGRELQKSGVMPGDVPSLIERVHSLQHISVQGLMTMGPFLDNPEDLRPYFRETRILFDEIKAMGIPGAEMRHLSMGMSDSYRIAIEEGSTMVRIGTKIFGPRDYPH